jgi:tetratricopeptide (TPR) repeat protein
MRDIVERQLAEDRESLRGTELETKAEAQKDGGLALVNLGFAYVTNGQYDRGIALMERGMAKGASSGVPNKKAQDSRLHLGIAYLMAGRKEKALEIFKSIDGVHGAADLGRLWAIHAR